MLLSRKVGVFLYPDLILVPYAEILGRWNKARFQPKKCRTELTRLLERSKLPEGLFRPEAVTQGGLAATDRLLYPNPRRWKFLLTLADEKYSVTGTLDPGVGRKASAGGRKHGRGSFVPELIRSLLKTENASEFSSRWGHLISGKAVGKLFFNELRQADRRLWPEVKAPGLYRREHASLVVHSRTTTIVLDPLLMANGEFPYIPGAPANLGVEHVDAVMITHSHGDHWHVPSILHYARDRSTSVIVPRVPRTNLLTTEDFVTLLGLVGLPVKSPPWGSTIKVGDIEVDILPFYGEQPTRESPGPAPGLRNWGNCYRFNTPEFSAIVLTDTGADPAGSMVEEARKSLHKRGPVDVVLSSVRSFASPFFGGIPQYILTLPFAQLQELFEKLKRGRLLPTTAGPDGIVEICAAAKARYFLPYANGFLDVGRDILDVGWGAGEPPENELVGVIAAKMRERRVKTRPLSWNAGDIARLSAGRLTIEGYPRTARSSVHQERLSA